jgi:AraC-like DNA-binding protein
MLFQTFSPSEIFKPFVEEYILIKGDTKNGKFTIDKNIPRIGGAIIFNFGDTPELIKGDNSNKLPQIFILGQQEKYRILKPGSNADVLIARLRITAIYHLFNILPENIKGKYIDAQQIEGAGISELFEEMKLQTDVVSKITILEKYFFNHLLKAREDKNYHLINSVIDKILESNGCIQIPEIRDIFNVEERTLRRNFIAQTGFTLKKYIRLTKFNFIVKELIDNPETEMIDIATRYGYFDQTHFIKEFKQFFGETPYTFVKRNKHSVLLLSAFS